MGWEIVERDARLTDRGRSVMHDARRHFEVHANA
jgi:hypothetical protein